MERKKYSIKRMNGSKWIRPELRTAIIAIRDCINDLRVCPYCLRSIEEHNISLSLDHITPRIFGGKNKASNLITACTDCNCLRNNMSIPDFLRKTFDYPEEVIAEIVCFINRQRVKTVDRTAGKELLEYKPVSYWSNYKTSYYYPYK